VRRKGRKRSWRGQRARALSQREKLTRDVTVPLFLRKTIELTIQETGGDGIKLSEKKKGGTEREERHPEVLELAREIERRNR